MYMGFCILLMTGGLSLRLFSLEFSTMSQKSEICQKYVSIALDRKAKNDPVLKQGHFWPFAPRQLVGVIFCLISSFHLNLADNYYFQEKLEMLTYN